MPSEENVVITSFPGIHDLTRKYRGLKVISTSTHNDRTTFELNNGMKITYANKAGATRLGRNRLPKRQRPFTPRRFRFFPIFRVAELTISRAGAVTGHVRTFYTHARSLLAATLAVTHNHPQLKKAFEITEV